ncbi:MAG: radical SAM family heme chaperone HemW [Anaerolineales bacterium]|nr:radical SAM family heme chaperone HemW [Anaerolineales bacterium]
MTDLYSPLSLYLHIPFCRHRCAYCDFNTYAGQEESIPAYVKALCREIEFAGQSAPEKLALHTIFFGGGTPSLLNPRQFEAVLKTISDHFDLLDLETTIEANPGTVSLSDLSDLRSLGINRISFGVQSANPFELRMLERQHSYFDVINAVTWARKAGFDNLNLDLIYGLPHQTLDNWSATLKLTLGLAPEHLSLYALTMEHGTPFGRWSARGLMPLPDPDLAADMYEWVEETLEAAGYQQYEISNWAVDRRPRTEDHSSPTVYSIPFGDRPPSRACAHNLQYWRGLPYLAAGAGAHGYVNGYRYSNVLRIKTYIDRLNTDNRSLKTDFPLTPATVNHHRQTLQDDMGEFMMTGLRLTREGVSAQTFHERFSQEMEDVFGNEIEKLIKLGLLEWLDSPLPMGAPSGDDKGMGARERVRLTRRGRLLGNQVFMRFVG